MVELPRALKEEIYSIYFIREDEDQNVKKLDDFFA